MFLDRTLIFSLAALAFALFLDTARAAPENPPEEGSVAVLLRDGPAQRFDQALVTVSGLELVGPKGTTAALMPAPRTVDLLQLTTVADLLRVAPVPAGRYTHLRLTLSDLRLRDLNLVDGRLIEEQAPLLPAAGRLEVRLDGALEVSAGDSRLLELDIDLGKSLAPAARPGASVEFTPVVFARPVQGDYTRRFTRIRGVVGDSRPGSFELCPTSVVAAVGPASPGGGCLTVAQPPGSLLPPPTGALQGPLPVGTPVVALGRLRRGSGPAPARFPGSHGLGRDYWLAAELVTRPGAPGTRDLAGTLTGEPGADRVLPLLPAPGQGMEGRTVAVGLGPQTRLRLSDGRYLALDDLQPGLGARVHGLSLRGPAGPALAASLVLVETRSPASRYSGRLQGVDPVTRSLTVSDRCVTLDAGTDLTLVAPEAEGSLSLGRTGLAGLMLALAGNAPLAVDVYGQERMDGCIAAQSVVAFGR